MIVGDWGRNLGASVGAAGDVNGDGYHDVIVAENIHGFTTGSSAVFVFYGSAAGLHPSPAWTYTGIPSSELGLRVSGAGDVNGDGYDDVIVGVPSFTNTAEGQAAFTVFYGSPAGLSAKPDWSVAGEKWHAYLGSAIDKAGDVNGDGYDDVIAGALLA